MFYFFVAPPLKSISSRNSKPWFFKAFSLFITKIPPFFSKKYLTNSSKMWRFTPWSIRNISYGSADYIIFEMEALSCYLFIHLNHIPFIRTFLSLIFYFIIQILFLYPDRHGRSSYSSGIWIIFIHDVCFFHFSYLSIFIFSLLYP